MDLPSRKPQRLKNYDYSNAGYYFITMCTQDRINLFDASVGAAPCGRPDSAYQMIIKWLKKIEIKFEETRIDKFVVMPNHVHFILVISGDHTGSPLHEIVGWFKTMTTNEYINGVKSEIYLPFNKRVWQRSYHDRIIRNEIEYQRIWQYIDTNPQKWEQDRYFNPIKD